MKFVAPERLREELRKKEETKGWLLGSRTGDKESPAAIIAFVPQTERTEEEDLCKWTKETVLTGDVWIVGHVNSSRPFGLWEKPAQSLVLDFFSDDRLGFSSFSFDRDSGSLSSQGEDAQSVQWIEESRFSLLTEAFSQSSVPFVLQTSFSLHLNSRRGPESPKEAEQRERERIDQALSSIQSTAFLVVSQPSGKAITMVQKKGLNFAQLSQLDDLHAPAPAAGSGFGVPDSFKSQFGSSSSSSKKSKEAAVPPKNRRFEIQIEWPLGDVSSSTSPVLSTRPSEPIDASQPRALLASAQDEEKGVEVEISMPFRLGREAGETLSAWDQKTTKKTAWLLWAAIGFWEGHTENHKQKIRSLKLGWFIVPTTKMVLGLFHSDQINEEDAVSKDWRSRIHSRFSLPIRPFFRRHNALDSLALSALSLDLQTGQASGSNEGENGRLSDVHVGTRNKSAVGGDLHQVEGHYLYYHYMQDDFDDKGWGCAYRSMQTLCSWFQMQGYSPRSAPSHKEIQQTLFRLGDKERSFIGSKQWIGAFEICLCLQELYGVSSRILNFSSGSEIPDRAREIAHHFDTQGTPIMIGGGVLAYTLLGIDWNQDTGAVEFLILDPHYTGREDLKVIQRSWCSWHKPSLFLSNAFYNFCLPQRPDEI